MNKFNLLATGAVLASAAAFAAGCGEQPAAVVQPVQPIDGSQLAAYGAIRIHPGEAKFVPVLTKQYPDAYSSLKAALPLITHQNRHGAVDPNAPTISGEPQRLDSHVSSGRDQIENDAACDTLNVDGSATSIGAIALSDQESDQPMVLWPKPGPTSEGGAANEVYLCFFENREPASGTILYESN